MARQGDVSTLAEAERNVRRLVEPDSPHEAWCIVADDALVGLVCVSVDDENRSGWFWYWMTDAARGRGWTAAAAATIAQWALTTGEPERPQAHPGCATGSVFDRGLDRSALDRRSEGKRHPRDPGVGRAGRARYLAPPERKRSPCLIHEVRSTRCALPTGHAPRSTRSCSVRWSRCR
ncbi:GNAT family N-acetyltransferase [Tomitella gaofuii]|uniref:GNAT family N-acetyltransferase n=1 Tax=Tomitella gaofuii TaxID=2760083 RepID=UPI0039A780C3